jgi:hypothetical protein
MDDLLKYASLITVAGAAISFMVGLYKWIDQRNREEEHKQHEVFFKLVTLASGKGDNGQTVSMNQQIAAIYHLQNYKRYTFASLPILELMKFEFESSMKKEDPRVLFMFEAINSTTKELKKS